MTLRKYQLKKLPVFTRAELIIHSILFVIGALLIITLFFFWFQPKHIPHNFTGVNRIYDILLFALLSYVVWYQIFTEFFSWMVAFYMKQPKQTKPEKNKKVAFLTAFVPGKEPYELLEQTLLAMKNTDYPHDTWLLDEGGDLYTKKLCRQYKVKYFTRFGKPHFNTPHGPFREKTKGGNYNAWFSQYGNRYDYVAQLDVDFSPKKDFLIKTLGYFKDPEVGFVGTQQIYGNTDESWIAKGAAEQAYNFYGSIQKGLFGQDMTLLIGANHVMRVAAHESIGGYSGHIVEDHLTGMKFYANRWKSVYVPEVLAVGEGPKTWNAYFSQQMRWAYGLIHILFTKSPLLFPKMRMSHVYNYFALQQYYFYGIAQVIGVILLCLYFIFGFQITPMSLIPLLAIYIPLIIWQQIMFLWVQRFNVDPERESGFMIRGKLLNWAAWPIYFIAFVGVLCRKRITYKVTPKGNLQNMSTSPFLFMPHFVLGNTTLLCLYFAAHTSHHAIQLLFWAVINTIFMFYFIGVVVLENGINWFKETFMIRSTLYNMLTQKTT
jgi:cellulose synthase/poly-beta-1,6-N-acetylglucosamine synthase-like glycosyltransferase